MAAVKTKILLKFFCTNFSSVSFDSYKENSSVIQCLNRLHELVDTEVYEGTFMNHTLFDVSDVENGLNHLKAGKACDFDGCLLYTSPSPRD